jgi:hypothetical protein
MSIIPPLGTTGTVLLATGTFSKHGTTRTVPTVLLVRVFSPFRKVYVF